MEKINWYPGHMKKTRELIEENLRLVDAVVEILDARIPRSSRNPVIKDLIGEKPEIVLLNKKDLAESEETDKWIASFREDGVKSVATDAGKGAGIKEFYSVLSSLSSGIRKDKKWDKPLRIMIVGIPNVGKSSLINRLTGRKAAKTGDKPGVTKGKQWLTLENGMQLLDTPGILWPNIDDPESGKHLAFTGAIKDEIYDIQDLMIELISYLKENNRDALISRYGIDEEVFEFDEAMEDTVMNSVRISEEIAKKRGFILSGKRVDYERTAKTLLGEFRDGSLGKITIEKA